MDEQIDPRISHDNSLDALGVVLGLVMDIVIAAVVITGPFILYYYFTYLTKMFGPLNYRDIFYSDPSAFMILSFSAFYGITIYFVFTYRTISKYFKNKKYLNKR